MALQPVVLDHYVLALDEAGFVEAFAERYHIARGAISRPAANKPHHRYRRLLRARRERPRGRRAAEQRDELASSYVEHGLPSGTRCASLPQAQDARKRPAGPWGRPESF